MVNADLFGDIDLLDIIPLIVIAAAEEAPKSSNSPTTSGGLGTII
jgi:hypothetical protein